MRSFLCVSAVCLSAVAPVVLVAGCAADSRGRTFDSTTGPGFTNDAGTGPLTSSGECAEDTKDIYVIAEDNTLYQFKPPTLQFVNKGVLRCPTGGATPTSMAVDRSGIAWVRHNDGSIWKVSTTDLGCEPTDFTAPGDNFAKFGMGFASESKGSSNEVLYLSDSAGAGLGRLDLQTLQVKFIGAYDGDLAGRSAELTGTGDGKLYGFFTTIPAQVAEISKGTGEILNKQELPGVAAGNAWAFSFYGGDFYIYTAASAASGSPPQANPGSKVTRYRPSTNTVEVVKESTGFKIVGAGVSTCAPTVGVN